VKYRFINEHRHEFRVTTICRVLHVARAGFYAWLHKPMSDRDIEDQRLLSVIRDSYTASGGVYGALRVFGDLRKAGESCGRHRVAKIMRANKIKAVRGYKSPLELRAVLLSFRPIASIASSPSMHRIVSGLPTSPICALGKAGCL
jgi:putative transposase